MQIREFLPDTRLDQCINMFTNMLGETAKLFKSISSTVSDKKQESSLFDKIKAVSEYVLRYMIGKAKPSFYDDMSFGTLADLSFTSYKKNIY